MTAPKIGNQNAISVDVPAWAALNDSAGAAFAQVLPASQAWLYSETFSVAPARFLSLGVFYTAHASTTTGYAKMRILVSNETAAPAISADSWVELPVPADTLGAAAALAGSIGTNLISAGPLRHQRTLKGAVETLPAAVANSDKVRIGLTYDVTGWRWCVIACQEVGDTTNRGTVTLNAALVA